MDENNFTVKEQCCFSRLVDFAMSRVGSFNIFDFSIMKICLSFTGLFLGIQFSDKLKKFAPIIGIIALISYFYMVYKIFFEKSSFEK